MYTLAQISLAAIFVTGTINSVFADDDTHASRAVKEGVQSSAHASVSAAHSIAASGQVTSAVLAVPLSVGGVALVSAGAVSAGVAHDLMQAATAPIGTSLVITDEVITVLPPNEALKAKNKATNP